MFQLNLLAPVEIIIYISFTIYIHNMIIMKQNIKNKNINNKKNDNCSQSMNRFPVKQKPKFTFYMYMFIYKRVIATQ